jgi:hypothetical protein
MRRVWSLLFGSVAILSLLLSMLFVRLWIVSYRQTGLSTPMHGSSASDLYFIGGQPGWMRVVHVVVKPGSESDRSRVLFACPYWVLVLMMLVLPALWLIRCIRRTRTDAPGFPVAPRGSPNSR